jgi:hypothetical protein
MFTFSDIEEQQQEVMTDSADAVVEGLAEEQEQAIDDQMSDVEKRLEIASYYRLLLRENLFDNDSEAGATVLKEVRGFIKDRLQVLLGLKAEKVAVVAPAQKLFSDDQLQALKALANKVLKKPDLVAPAAEAPKAPGIRQVKGPDETGPKLASAKANVVAAPVAPAKGKPGPKKGQQKKVYKTVVDPSTGKEVQMDVTPVVKPPPNSGFVPTQSKAQFESLVAAQASIQATANAEGMQRRLEAAARGRNG